VRLLLDAHVSWRHVGQRLEENGHDIRSLNREPEYTGLRDPEVLALAAEDKRILVTRDVKDFRGILRRWAGAGRSHAGALLIYGLESNEFDLIVRGIERALAMYPDPESWTDFTASIDRAFATEGFER
jgi:predicted nuclease of predicted toxin-antitoxin system